MELNLFFSITLVFYFNTNINGEQYIPKHIRDKYDSLGSGQASGGYGIKTGIGGIKTGLGNANLGGQFGVNSPFGGFGTSGQFGLGGFGGKDGSTKTGTKNVHYGGSGNYDGGYGGGGGFGLGSSGGFGGGGGYGGSHGGGVKHTDYKGGCAAAPSPPMNARMRCSKYSGCQSTCIENYQFPNGQNQLFITCKDGEWQVEGTEWETIPSCEPICNPPCQNNGICIMPNVCNCPENFSGTQCQIESKPCLNVPPLPINSRRTCSSTSCTITCMKGYQYPDGSTITNLLCKNGVWVPSREDWRSVPDCQATCNPPCQNGGNCLAFNVCQCPQEFRGPQCQYSTDVCKAKRMQFNGGYNCTGTSDSVACSLWCPSGIEFEFPPASNTYTCSYSEGIFKPQPIPQCVYGENVQVIPLDGTSESFATHHKTGNKNSSFSIDDMFINGAKVHPPGSFHYQIDQEHPFKPGKYNDSTIITIPVKGGFGTKESGDYGVIKKPGSCFTWGGSHYKTFDGKVFSFDSPCSYTLVRDAVDNTFSIVIRNSQECQSNPDNCHRVIKIYQQDREYTLTRASHGIPIFARGKKILPIPGRVPGIRTEMSAHYVVILLDSVGAKLKWDGQQFIQVEVQEGLWNRTGGLCGKIDGDLGNDMLTKEGTKPKSVVTLASSWQVDTLGETCNDIPTEEHVCQDTQVKGSKGQKAMHFCKKLLSDKRFAKCHAKMDISLLLDACRWDYCSCKHVDSKICACETLNVYVRECGHKGVTGLVEWRDEHTCPIKCTGGRIYMSCGPPGGQAVCGGIDEEVEDTSCEEGCYCPTGTVLHDSECIMKENCPCMYKGKQHPPASSVSKDCNTCTCVHGQWICTKLNCGARCSALGDPHYITFDGKRYDFMGQCTYYLVKHDNFTIEAENAACAGSISQAMNFPISVSSGFPSCTKTVIITIGGHTIKLKQNHEISINGREIANIPYAIAGANIRAVSSIFLVVELANGIEVWWDGLTRAYIDVPASFMGHTQGLCGTFNANQKDDFLTPEGDIENSVIPFANKWKTSEKCTDIPDDLKSHPCEINIHNKATAEEHCKIIKSDMFADCHWEVDPEPFYQDCLYDTCSCETKLSKCLCPMLASYAAECARTGVKVEWRTEVRECGMHCPGGQKYQICGNSCTRSCYDIATKSDCRQQCVEGCNCPEGEALDEHGECIPIGQCGCSYEGLDFPPGYKEIRPASRAPELCTCINAQWNCRTATPGELIEYPKASDLKTLCSAAENKEFTTCEPVEPVTCKNMHSLESFSAAVCHPGCQCKKGYVLDTFTKTCVKPTDCPCHHGGKSYSEGANVHSDCNTCTCTHGKWNCTDKACDGECSAWGDSHYKTFDGKMYDYQGQCDYIFAKGAIGNEHSFDVYLQNVPCGTLGVSCSKSITIKVGVAPNKESITLTREKQIPEHATLKHLTIRQKGQYVIVEAPELGFRVRWDRGTKVYVKLSTLWKNKVKGLCGNYNDNEMDDFQTPSGGISEVSTIIFGDSWRLQPYCPEAIEITDTCAQRPERKVWALKQCGVLKSPVFAKCHSEVPIEPYIEKCVFDTCGCDQGGDCMCLCTSLSAYAQECSNKGVHVKWRTPDLCPMQCDERCAHYSPCVSTCPTETCDNMLVHNQLSKICEQEICIEGCQTKPCPPNFIYLNSSLLECVPRNICKPLCLEINGISYYEGDIVEKSDCHQCYCSRGKKVCQGQPCLTTIMPVTDPDAEPVKCSSGWTEWINQDQQSTKGSQRKLIDVEPLPGPIIMNHLSGEGHCMIKNMVDIECRTVKTHISPKETGLDAECSLERGLFCNSAKGGIPCADFEIRVKCDCEDFMFLSTECDQHVSPARKFTMFIEPTKEPFPPSECDVGQPLQKHPYNCHLYYQCIPGAYTAHQIERSCGPHMMYNPKTMVCDHPHQVLLIRPECHEDFKPTPITSEVPTTVCPVGEYYSDCAIECQRLCLYYGHTIRLSGHCQKDQKCESGCFNELKQVNCPVGMFWANPNTCVSIQDCMCISSHGKPVKPGETVIESECKVCQCLDNYYICDESKCSEEWGTKEQYGKVTKSPIVTDESSNNDTISRGIGETGEVIVVPSHVTPPQECNEEDYIHLIDGELPLGDDAFSASSTSGKPFAPKFGRLSAKVTGDSSGSWSPQTLDKNQYLQINLGRQEPIYGILMQGNLLYDEYVTSFKVLYTPDGHTFSFVTDANNRPKTFHGSLDSTTTIKQMFDVPVEAHIIRINPQTWHKRISLKVELIGCKKFQVTTTTVPTTPPIPQCIDSMGVGDGMMNYQQISVSSELLPHHTKKQIKPKSKFGWQPITNSPSEWVQFDFLEPRNITGFVSQGGPDGWVTAFKVMYSHDGHSWNPILDDEWNEQVFLGNVDEDTPQIIGFNPPIQTRLLKIVPIKWSQNIQLRIEPHGCFVPYPTQAYEVTELPPSPCNSCPGAPSAELELGACKCKEDLWWDGEHCVDRTQCPCIVGHIPYAVGTVFEIEDCSQCVCKLGGVSHCTPKVCDQCDRGLRGIVTSTCNCKCQPCDEGTTLCPTSNICINTVDWCNGVKDCPDDETGCGVVPTQPSIVEIFKPTIVPAEKIKECPEPNCPPGYRIKFETHPETSKTKAGLQTMFSSSNKKGQTKTSFRKGGTKTGVKGAHKGSIQRPPVVPENEQDKQDQCKVFKCIADAKKPTKKVCPIAACPPGYNAVYDAYTSSDFCPGFECVPPPPVDAVCNVTGRTFNTFDLIEYKYDICNHILARDLINDQWEVSLQKTCNEICCTYNLIIYQDNNKIVLHPDMTIEYDGYNYTVEQTKKIGSQSRLFAMTRLGDTLVFVSNKHGFWVIWDDQGNVKLGVTRKLLGKVDGLCGYFNDNPRDDKRKPDGTHAKTTQEFGDSWMQADQPAAACETKGCPYHIQSKAWEMCNLVKRQTFAACGKVVDVDAFVSHCLDTACTCLEAAIGSKEAEDKCRCVALQSFVVDCLSTNPNTEVMDWRMKYDCPAICDAPLVHHDCYQRRCEPSCGALSADSCPKLDNVCFPGCYCPPGYVRKDKNCILPTSCGDCECNVLPHLEYTTYDERNFTINGNCTYIMSRDLTNTKNKNHKFQVLITNHPCEDKKGKMCVGKVTILFMGHKIHVVRDDVNKKLNMIVNSEILTEFKEVSQWAHIKEEHTKHLKITLHEIQVKVSIYYPSLGVSVKAPSLKYGGKLEGLCGDCDGNANNDLPMSDEGIAKDVDNYGLHWLYDTDIDKEQCHNPPEEQCKPVLIESDPCIQLEDITKYGQCHPVLSPNMFIEWCRKDTCNSNPELSCTAIETYSRECGFLGFCVDWRTHICPAKVCSTGQEYRPCAPACTQTCEAHKDPHKKCNNAPVEGCFCPEGMLFLNQTCVTEERCEACDDEGHHSGDVWHKDVCTKCSCEGTTVKCETQTCPSVQTVCQQGFMAMKVPAKEECCDKYICVPEPTVATTCEPPQHLVCGPGQVMKLITRPDHCQQFVCECKPIDECEAVDATDEPLQAGIVREIDTTGCCPVVKEICKIDLCPRPTPCPKFHTPDVLIIPGICCPERVCLRPKDKCIVDLQYTPDEHGGERLRNEYEKQQVLKEANETWKDGPCRECQCIISPVSDYYDICTVAECPVLTESIDHQDYILEAEPIVGQCCPNIKKVACKHYGKEYKVNEAWPVEGDYCTTIECKEGPSGIQKVTTVSTCDTKCELGWEYKPALPDSKQCCGSCKPVACVVNGIVHNIGDEWSSPDHCTNFFCVNLNGSVQVQSVLVNCPELPEDVINEYVVETVPVEGECCQSHTIVACKVGNTKYRVGETWPSPDGDKCKKFTCIDNQLGEIMKQEAFETCNTNCSKGWEYKESDSKCCGECLQVACVVGNELKKPGESWKSPDGCTTYFCDLLGDQFTVITQQESCPNVDDCPLENIYTQGCCKHCNMTAAAQVQCGTEELSPLQTIGLVSAVRPPHGRCVNKENLKGFTRCLGTCQSSTAYNTNTGLHDSICTCCQAVKFAPMLVHFECDDGYRFKKQIAIPAKCGCEGCVSQKYTKGGSKTGTKTGTKTGIKTG